MPSAVAALHPLELDLWLGQMDRLPGRRQEKFIWSQRWLKLMAEGQEIDGRLRISLAFSWREVQKGRRQCRFVRLPSTTLAQSR
jgi:hypothetical protein